MAITALEIGDDAAVTATFTVSGVNTDPTTVTFTVRQEDASAGTSYVYGPAPEVTRTGAGIYLLTYPVTLAGVHQVRCVGTGAAKGAVQGEFVVVPLNV